MFNDKAWYITILHSPANSSQWPEGLNSCNNPCQYRTSRSCSCWQYCVKFQEFHSHLIWKKESDSKQLERFIKLNIESALTKSNAGIIILVEGPLLAYEPWTSLMAFLLPLICVLSPPVLNIFYVTVEIHKIETTKPLLWQNLLYLCFHIQHCNSDHSSF